nr:immunoglobulin light chain junction region [Macaca mulatta]
SQQHSKWPQLTF